MQCRKDAVMDENEILNVAKAESKPDEGPSKGSFAWHFIFLGPIAVFCLLYFPFREFPWGIFVATLVTYSVFIAWYFLTNKDLADARDRADAHIPKMLSLHLVFLAVVYGLESYWLLIRPKLPSWMLAEGRKGSLYY
jgi:hypothetical protein